MWYTLKWDVLVFQVVLLSKNRHIYQKEPVFREVIDKYIIISHQATVI